MLRSSRGWQELMAREHQQELAGGLRAAASAPTASGVCCGSKD
jgi:hypothetical protein